MNDFQKNDVVKVVNGDTPYVIDGVGTTLEGYEHYFMLSMQTPLKGQQGYRYIAEAKDLVAANDSLEVAA